MTLFSWKVRNAIKFIFTAFFGCVLGFTFYCSCREKNGCGTPGILGEKRVSIKVGKMGNSAVTKMLADFLCFRTFSHISEKNIEELENVAISSLFLLCVKVEVSFWWGKVRRRKSKRRKNMKLKLRPSSFTSVAKNTGQKLLTWQFLLQVMFRISHQEFG